LVYVTADCIKLVLPPTREREREGEIEIKGGEKERKEL